MAVERHLVDRLDQLLPLLRVHQACTSECRARYANPMDHRQDSRKRFACGFRHLALVDMRSDLHITIHLQRQFNLQYGRLPDAWHVDVCEQYCGADMLDVCGVGVEPGARLVGVASSVQEVEAEEGCAVVDWNGLGADLSTGV